MLPHPAPLVVTWGIALIAVGIGVLLVMGVRVAAARSGLSRGGVSGRTGCAATAAAAWLGAFAIAAGSGALARFDLRPPPLMIAAVAAVGGALFLGLSRVGGLLARGLPLAALVGFQAFRLPLELVMHRAAAAGVMPPEMTWSGWNYDVVTGGTAALLAPLVALERAPRWLVLGWNAMGSVLVLVVMGVGIAGTPVFRAFGEEHLNTWIAYFPFVWLPAVMVVAAVAGHILVFRRLAAARAVSSTG